MPSPGGSSMQARDPRRIVGVLAVLVAAAVSVRCAGNGQAVPPPASGVGGSAGGPVAGSGGAPGGGTGPGGAPAGVGPAPVDAATAPRPPMEVHEIPPLAP